MSAQLLELGTKPISPEAPAGTPGRDAPEFEFLQNEVRKLELPDQPTVNWDGAVTNAATLLASRSKDLLIAAYLAVGLFERDGFPGLDIGLTILRDLVTTMWQPLFPDISRMRGRASAFEWLNDRGAQRVRRRAGRGATAEVVQACLERVGQVQDVLGPLMDSGAYALIELRDALNEAMSAAPEPASSGARDDQTASGGGGSPIPARVSSIDSPGDYELALSQVRELLVLAGGYLYRTEPQNPLTYRWPRMFLWMNVTEVPPNEDGLTQIPGPEPELVDQLEAMFEGGQFDGLIQQAEDHFMNSGLWLDLHRFTARSLQEKGGEFDAAADGVALETRALLQRVPGIASLRFANGTPFANDATRKWIEKTVMSGGGGIDMSSVPQVPIRIRGGEGFVATVEDARKLARSKKLGEAIALLEKGALRSERLDDRVAWKLEVAKVCIAASQFDLALAQLEGLEDELEHSKIEQWDPQLCADVLKSILTCRRKMAESSELSPEEWARQRQVMSRLCRLDLQAALELNGKS